MYQFLVGPLEMALRCALSIFLGKVGAAFLSCESLGLVFIGTGRQGVTWLVASGGGVVDDILWWQLGKRVKWRCIAPFTAISGWR